MASSSPGAPKTIKQYQTALVRLGVAIPAGQKKLADYEALWRVAVSPDENAEPTNSTEPLAREKSPARSRPTRNVPLSQQTPRNIPLSQQTPPAPRTPVPADDGVDAPTTSPDEDALVTDATTEASQHPSRSSWALPAAMLVGCAVILFVALSLGTVHAPDRTAIVSAGHPFEAASDAEATWTALDRAELAAEAVASGETERGDTEPEEAASVLVPVTTLTQHLVLEIPLSLQAYSQQSSRQSMAFQKTLLVLVLAVGVCHCKRIKQERGHLQHGKTNDTAVAQDEVATCLGGTRGCMCTEKYLGPSYQPYMCECKCCATSIGCRRGNCDEKECYRPKPDTEALAGEEEKPATGGTEKPVTGADTEKPAPVEK